MVSFLAITAATVLIAETTSTGTANGITTTVLRIAVVAVLVAWTVTYSKRHQRRQGERRGGGDAGLPLSKPAPAARLNTNKPRRVTSTRTSAQHPDHQLQATVPDNDRI